MPNPKFDKYKGINFDQAKATEAYNEYEAQHPEADRLALQSVLDKIVAKEAVIATRLQVMENENANFDKAAKETEIRDKIKNDKDPVYNFFANFDGPEFKDILVKFQNDYAGRNNYRSFFSHSRETFLNLTRATSEAAKQDYEKLHTGEHLDQALFAPKTNPDALNYAKESPEAEQQIKEWADDINSVEIPVPEGMDDDFVEFAVMGEMLKDENLLKAAELTKAPGSTLYAAIDDINTVRMSFFENMTMKDGRLNMHSSMSIVSECRRKVKSQIEAGNLDALKESFKTAFTNMYEYAMSNLLDMPHTLYSSLRLEQLLGKAEQYHLSNEDLGIDAKKLENIKLIQLKLDMYREKRIAQADVNRYAIEYYLSNGNRPQLGPNSKHPMQERYADVMAYAAMIRAIDSELNAEKAHALHPYMNDKEKIADRSIGVFEQKFLEHPYASFKYFRSKAVESQQYKNFITHDAMDFDTRLRYIPHPENAIDIYDGTILFGDWKRYETEYADLDLKWAKEETDKILAEAKSQKQHMEIADVKCLNALKNISAKINSIIEMRANDKKAGVDFTDRAHAEKMAEEYDGLAKAFDAYVEADPANTWLPSSKNYLMTFADFNILKKAFRDYDRVLAVQNEGLQYIAGVKSAEYLYSVPANEIGSLQWGISKDQHVTHFFDGPSKDMIAIDTSKAPEQSAFRVDQQTAYNTGSDAKTQKKFKELLEFSAKEYERNGIDKEYKNILRGIKNYITAERRSTQQTALTELNKNIAAYEKKHAKDLKNLAFAVNMDNLGKLKKTLGSFTNGNLQPDPSTLTGPKPKEPADAGFGHLGIWTKTNEALFPHEPSPNDIKQGLINDCFMMSALSKIAKDHPEQIRNAMRDNGDGTVSVRFYTFSRNTKPGKYNKTPVDIRVNKTVNKSLTGQHIYSSSALWVQIMEKAYAEFVTRQTDTKYYAGDQKNKGFQRLDRGSTDMFMNVFDPEKMYRNEDLSFGSAGYTKDLYKPDAPKRNAYTQQEKEFFEIVSRTNSGEVMTCGVKDPSKAQESFNKSHGILQGHAYAVMGTFEKEVNGVMKKFVQVRDPFATFSSKYNDKGELVNDSTFISSSRYAGNDNMGTFNLELTDFMKSFNSFPGMTVETQDVYRAKITEWYNKKDQILEEARQLAQEANGIKIDDKIEIVNDAPQTQKNVGFMGDDVEIIEEEPKAQEKGGFMDDVEIINDAPKPKEKNSFMDEVEIVEEIPNPKEPSKKEQAIADGKEYMEKLSARSNDAIKALAQQPNTPDNLKKMQQSLATLLTVETIDNLVDRVGEGMSVSQCKSLLSKETLQASTKDLYKSAVFKELCKGMKPEDYLAIANDPANLTKCNDKLNKICVQDKQLQNINQKEGPKKDNPEQNKPEEKDIANDFVIV